ncbi:hypothetical protein EZS27_016017 [termite gut metagenome]|uniref:Uncharacterized protein n=1 Tax=termite gut metagenome TaxID=433724 RepID=A0A5J4RQK5_9ZZZZ
MKSYEETVRRTAALDWKIKSKYPTAYMKEVFGVTEQEDPKLIDILIAASHCGGIHRLFDTLPKAYLDNMVRYISK